VNENSWGAAPDALPYARAKILSEREAWDVQVAHERSGGRMRFATILPGRLVGPLLLPTRCSSADKVQSLLEGTSGSVPDAYLGFTDVRDAARLHVAAMLDQNSNGRRVLACTAHRSLQDLAGVLHQEFAVDGYLVPTARRWDCTVWLAACVCRSAQARLLAPHLSQKEFTYETHLAEQLNAGMPPWTPFEASIREMGHSLLQAGLVRDITPGRVLSQGGLQLYPSDTTGLHVWPTELHSPAAPSPLRAPPDLASLPSGASREAKTAEVSPAHSAGAARGSYGGEGSAQSYGEAQGGDVHPPHRSSLGGGTSHSESSSSDEKPGGVDAPTHWRQLRGAVSASRTWKGDRGGHTPGEGKHDSVASDSPRGPLRGMSSGESK